MYDKINAFCVKHRKPITWVLATVLPLAFLGSVAGAIFSGGEFIQEEEIAPVKGMLRVEEADYSTTYLTGDKFKFDKDSAKVILLAKDPAIEKMVKIDDLPQSEYGFKPNGEGDFILDPSEITMDQSIKTVEVVSRVYPDIFTEIPVNVLGEIDQNKLTNELLMEAEECNLYQDGKLLTQEEKETLPQANNPFLSNKGSVEEGRVKELPDASGGVVLRNFNNLNMKMEYVFVSTEDTTLDLEIMICKRPDANKKMKDNYDVKLNDKTVDDIANLDLPQGPRGQYFDSYKFEGLKLNVQRGLNILTFENRSRSAVNFDAIKLSCEENIIGSEDAIISAGDVDEPDNSSSSEEVA